MVFFLTTTTTLESKKKKEATLCCARARVVAKTWVGGPRCCWCCLRGLFPVTKSHNFSIIEKKRKDKKKSEDCLGYWFVENAMESI